MREQKVAAPTRPSSSEPWERQDNRLQRKHLKQAANRHTYPRSRRSGQCTRCLLCGHSDGRRVAGRSRPLANSPIRKPRVAYSKRRTHHPPSRISNPRGAANVFWSLDRWSPNGKNGRVRGRSVIDVWRTQGGRDERVQRRMGGQVGEGWGGLSVSGRDIDKGLKSWWVFGNGRRTVQSWKNAVSERVGGAHSGSRAAMRD